MVHSAISETFSGIYIYTYIYNIKNIASVDEDIDPTDGDEIEEEDGNQDDILMDKLGERFNKDDSMQH